MFVRGSFHSRSVGGLFCSVALIGALAAATSVRAENGVYGNGYMGGYPAGNLAPNATTRLDFGGGSKMGSMIAKLNSGEVGGAGTGYITSRFGLGELKFADGRGSVKFYGQSNNGLVFADGDDNDTYLGTNAATQNYLGARVKYDWNNDLTFGARLSVAGAFNRSDIYSDTIDDNGCDEENRDQYFCARDANAFVRHRTFGKITAGLGETAFAGIGSTNLGGIAYVTNNDPTLKAGGLDIPTTGMRLGDIAPDVTGVGRGTLIRYDTPTIAGFVVSASWGEANHLDAPAGSDGYYDVALRYAGEFGAIRVAGGIGYQDYDREGGDDRRQSNAAASASIQHTPTGLYVAGSYNNLNRDADFDPAGGETDDASAWYVQAGISQDYFGIGKTTLYAEYGKTENGADAGAYFLEDSETRNFGIGAVQNIDGLSKSVYATYNNIEGERLGTSGDVNVFMLGGRMKF